LHPPASLPLADSGVGGCKPSRAQRTVTPPSCALAYRCPRATQASPEQTHEVSSERVFAEPGATYVCRIGTIRRLVGRSHPRIRIRVEGEGSDAGDGGIDVLDAVEQLLHLVGVVERGGESGQAEAGAGEVSDDMFVEVMRAHF
jgi:hypothetical protein